MGQPSLFDLLRAAVNRALAELVHEFAERPVQSPVQPCEGGAQASQAQAALAAAIAGASALGVQVAIVPGGPNRYQSDAGLIEVDGSLPIEAQILQVIHETTHAEYTPPGTGGFDPSESRGDYVDRMLAEEAEATVRQIEAADEMRNDGLDVYDETIPLNDEYWDAYNSSMEQSGSDPAVSRQSREDAARESGRRRVEDGFRAGEVTHEGRSYSDEYGDQYDQLSREVRTSR